jgi:2'-5' RNA ligase
MQQHYFIGITLPKDLSKAIADIQRDLYQPQRVLLPLTPHITLLEPNLLSMLPTAEFIPEVKKLAEQFLPFKISLTRTSSFGKNVFYISAVSEELLEMQQNLEELLEKATYGRMHADRPFNPHVTLAQAKRSQILSIPFIEHYKSYVDPLLPKSFTVDELAYFQWVHPRSYALYEI